MSTLEDPFEVLVMEGTTDISDASSRNPVATTRAAEAALPQAVTARFHGFDLEDQPLVVGVPNLPHEIVAARTTVPLLRSQIGSTVVLVFEHGDPRRPIVVGVLLERRPILVDPAPGPSLVSKQADDDRLVMSAEREIVLRCGDASITLTRAGKVIIKGTYVVSRSSGYNKIKGAAVDIN
jgi:hypothetical protein